MQFLVHLNARNNNGTFIDTCIGIHVHAIVHVHVYVHVRM